MAGFGVSATGVGLGAGAATGFGAAAALGAQHFSHSAARSRRVWIVSVGTTARFSRESIASCTFALSISIPFYLLVAKVLFS